MSDNLTEFIDFVEAGRPMVKERDKFAWALGALAAKFVETCVKGRPANDDNTPRLGDLATAWDVPKPRVSEWRNTHLFYPDNVRLDELSWTHHNLARQKSGGDIEVATRKLNIAKSQHMGIPAFRRHLDGIYYEGPIKVAALPPELQAMIPPGTEEVWGTLKRKDGEA